MYGLFRTLGRYLGIDFSLDLTLTAGLFEEGRIKVYLDTSKYESRRFHQEEYFRIGG